MDTASKPSLKLMIVDDSNIIRRRIERSQQIARLEVVGAASNGREAVELFRRTQPDVVTMDLTMPEMDGVECVQQLVALNSNVLILVVSALADKATAEGCHREGSERLPVQAVHRPSAQRRIGRAAVGGLMLKEAEIRTFIEGATHYFEMSAQQIGHRRIALSRDGRQSRRTMNTRESSAFPAPARASSTSPPPAACSRCCC